MLVLSRKLEELIIIDSTIQIKVLSISKRQVKLGISAPAHMQILRDELIGTEPIAAVLQENQQIQESDNAIL